MRESKIKFFTIAMMLLAVVMMMAAPAFAQLTEPAPLDPTSKASLNEWWAFLYAMVAPIATWLVTRFFPAHSKKELIIKAFITAILVLVAFIVAIGAKLNIMTVLFAVIGLIGQKFLYDNVLNPLNIFRSKKARDYKAD